MSNKMKYGKSVFIFLIMAFLAIGLADGVLASERSGEMGENVQEGEYNGLTYLYDSSKAVITGYVGELPDVTIPETINGLPVTDLAEQAFKENHIIETVTIEAPVTKISERCFFGSSLQRIYMPDTVRSIGSWAFSGTELADIDWPANIEEIGEVAFSGCDRLKNVSLPETVRVLGLRAFDYCHSLESFLMPEDLEIEEVIFDGCVLLKEVTLSSKVKKVAFQNCYSLGSLVLPDTVTELEEGSFENCYCLTEIYIPGSVTNIPDGIFGSSIFLTIYGEAGSYAESYAEANQIPFSIEEMPGEKAVYETGNSFFYILYGDKCMISGYLGEETDVTIPAEIGGHTVTHLAPAAFKSTNIVKLRIEAQIETLPDECFWGARSLQNVVLPESLKRIGKSCFSVCSSLTNILIPKGVTSLGWNCFEMCESLETFTIPSTVTEIGQMLLSGCDNLRSVTVEEGIRSLPNAIFSDDRALEEVSLPDTLESIGAGAFGDCKSLHSVVLPKSITKIEGETFSGCLQLKQVILSEGIVSIGGDAFSECISLGGVYIPDTVVSINESAFRQCHLLTICGSKESYAGNYANRLQIPFSTEDASLYETKKVIQDEIEYICGYDKAIVIGETVRHTDLVIPKTVNGKKIIAIRDGAFAARIIADSCLKTVVIEAELKELGSCFHFNPNLRSVQLPDTLEMIGPETFSGCEQLEYINLPECLKAIGSNTFRDCSSLKKADMPKHLKTIEFAAFMGCSSLREVDLPEGLEILDSNAFMDCISLEKITIPDGIRNLKQSIFAGCTKLKEVNLPSELEYIEGRVFYNCMKLSGIYMPTGFPDDVFENCYFLVISALKGSNAIESAKNYGIKYVEIDYDEENGGFDGEISSEVIDDIGNEQELPILSETGKAIFDIGATIEIKHRHGNKDVTFNYDIVDKNSVENEAMHPALDDAAVSGGCALDFALADSLGQTVLFHSEENNGTVTITVPYAAPVSANKVTVYYIAPDGTKTDMHGVYDSSTKTVTFTTTHFSMFTIETDVNLCDTGHDYEEEVIAATCTESGYTIHMCVRCSHTYTDSETDALGHDWNEGAITIPPSVTETGIKTFTCRRCHMTRTEEIPRLTEPVQAEIPVIAAHPKGASYKKGDIADALRVTASVADGGTLRYQWYRNAQDSNENGTVVSNGTSAAYTPSTEDIGTLYYYCVITNTKGNGENSAVTHTARIEVTESFTQGTKSDGQTEEGGLIKYKGLNYRINRQRGEAAVISAANFSATSFRIPGFVIKDGKKYKITSIASNAFKNNKKMKNVTIGPYIKKIGRQAFYGCKKLKKITLQSGKIKTIQGKAWKGLPKNVKVKLPKKLSKKQKREIRQKLIRSGISKQVDFV